MDHVATDKHEEIDKRSAMDYVHNCSGNGGACSARQWPSARQWTNVRQQVMNERKTVHNYCNCRCNEILLLVRKESTNYIVLFTVVAILRLIHCVSTDLVALKVAQQFVFCTPSYTSLFCVYNDNYFKSMSFCFSIDHFTNP